MYHIIKAESGHNLTSPTLTHIARALSLKDLAYKCLQDHKSEVQALARDVAFLETKATYVSNMTGFFQLRGDFFLFQNIEL